MSIFKKYIQCFNIFKKYINIYKKKYINIQNKYIDIQRVDQVHKYLKEVYRYLQQAFLSGLAREHISNKLKIRITVQQKLAVIGCFIRERIWITV